MSKQDKQTKKPTLTKLSPIMKYVLIFVCVVIAIGLIYLTLVRYKYAVEAIKKGDTLKTLAMLSPELTGTIGAIINI